MRKAVSLSMCTWRLLSVLKASSICPNSFEGIPLPSGVRASKGWRGKGPNFHEMHFCVILCHRLNLRKESWEWEVSFSCTLRNPSFWRALWIGQFSTPWETLWEFWSRQLIGWVLQDFQETCVLHSLTVLLNTKPLTSNPLMENKSSTAVTMRTLDFSKYVKLRHGQ